MPDDRDAGDEIVNADHAESARARFLDSMKLDFERWKEGTGYDLDALSQLSPAGRREMEARMTPPAGWRDVEALAELGTPTAASTLAQAAHSGNVEVRMAVLRHAPQLLDDAERTNALVRALAEAAPFAGRTETLDRVMDFHPPAVVQALFVGLIASEGDMAYHCAATLAAIHDIVHSRFDWSLRPQYLAFNTDDASARRMAFLDFCTTLGVDGPACLAEVDRVIATKPASPA